MSVPVCGQGGVRVQARTCQCAGRAAKRASKSMLVCGQGSTKNQREGGGETKAEDGRKGRDPEQSRATQGGVAAAGGGAEKGGRGSPSLRS